MNHNLTFLFQKNIKFAKVTTIKSSTRKLNLDKQENQLTDSKGFARHTCYRRLLGKHPPVLRYAPEYF
jgi:predicted transport protein